MDQWVLDRRRFFPVAQKCGQEALAASIQRPMADAHFLCRYAGYYLTAPVQRPAADDPAPPAKVQLVVEVVLPGTVEGQMDLGPWMAQTRWAVAEAHFPYR